MADTSLSGEQKITAELANARQTLELLKSQLRANVVEQDYWMARLSDLGQLLATIVEERSASDQQRRLAALYEVSKVLGSSLDLGQVLNQVMDAIIRLTGAERGFLMLFDDQGELEVKAARNMARETLEEEEFAISRSVIRTVAETGEQVVTTNAAEDPRFATQSSVVAHHLRSIQCVPLRARGKIIGVIYVDNRIRTGVFDEADLEMLSTFAAQAAIAIENARLFTMTDEALAARVEELSMMQEIDRQLNETLDFGKVMGLTLDWAVRVAEADNGAIGFIDLEEGEVRVVARHGETPAGVTSILSDGQMSERNGSLTVPIQREGRAIGVIALDRSDKRPFSPEAHAFVLRLADHAAISIENTQLYEAVKRANDAKSEFVSVITHELRVPMTAIKGYTEMIAMTATGLPDQQRGFLDIISGNIERMSILVSDLSDVSRIETGRLKLEVEDKVIVRRVLDDILPSLQTEIEGRKHKFVVDFPDDLPTVQVDPHRLGQILTNLISNAYKYTPNGGTLTVRAREEDGFVYCEVADTGVGMTPEELENLFTKFWRAEDAHVREQTGTGLGLVIAKNLVELQGGEMTVRSKKGEGTTFTFTIPATPKEG